MKIGIVTFYGVANYGAMLQAYALWKYLENRGHAVEFIDVINCHSRRLPLWRCLVSRSVKGLRCKLANYVQYHIVDFSASYPQTRRFAGFLDLKENCPRYDALIVGSDQMWNPKWCVPGGSIPVVFLDFVPKGCRRISYAASFGVKEWGHSESAETVGRLLREFQAISVREQSGVKIVRDLSGRDAECLIDPTLLAPDGFYSGLMSDEIRNQKPYVFNYILHGWTDGALEKSCLAAVLRENELKTVLSDKSSPLGLLSPLCRILGVKDRVNVAVWLERIAHSSFVVTNSFHGTVFSILFKKPFVTVLMRGSMAGMNERVYSLLEKLGLLERIIDDESRITHAIHASIDWKSVSLRLEELRNDAASFFARNEL